MKTNNLKTANKSANSKSFIYSFNTAKSPEEIFGLLLDPNKWWVGFYEEIIAGKSTKINDEFTFLAGGGLHYTKQRLIELVPHSKIVWLVFESNLTFINDPKEWVNTKIRFEISNQGEKTKVTFTHEGLIPRFECYNNCSNAWTGYLESLENTLNKN